VKLSLMTGGASGETRNLVSVRRLQTSIYRPMRSTWTIQA